MCENICASDDEGWQKQLGTDNIDLITLRRPVQVQLSRVGGGGG
jgi:hypothetical protein